MTALSLGYAYHKTEIAGLTAKYQDQLAAQRATDAVSCSTQMQITRKVSDAYQSKITALSGQLVSLKRVSSGRCIPILDARGGPGGHDAAPGHAGHAGKD